MLEEVSAEDEEEEEEEEVEELKEQRVVRTSNAPVPQVPKLSKELTRPIASFSPLGINYTVGRIEDGAAILLSGDHNMIEIPMALLPPSTGPGNILKFVVERNMEAEKRREQEILTIQRQILEDPNFFENL